MIGALLVMMMHTLKMDSVISVGMGAINVIRKDVSAVEKQLMLMDMTA
jgi:hypothetical protein